MRYPLEHNFSCCPAYLCDYRYIIQRCTDRDRFETFGSYQTFNHPNLCQGIAEEGRGGYAKSDRPLQGERAAKKQGYQIVAITIFHKILYGFSSVGKNLVQAKIG